MKRTRRIFIIAFLLCIYTYCCKIDSIPNSIILYGGEQLNIGNFAGISLKIGDKDCDTVLASSEISSATGSENKEATVDVKLFNTFNVKEVSVSIIDKTTVVPVGQVSGLKLYTNGVLVVGMSEIKGIDNQKYKPYENSGIEEGDRITKINNEEVTDTNLIILENMDISVVLITASESPTIFASISRSASSPIANPILVARLNHLFFLISSSGFKYSSFA